MLEERLDEAAAAIETARKAGADSGRIAFLTAQLAKSREQVKTALAAVRAQDELKAGADKLANLIGLAAQRMKDSKLIDPARDSARFYVLEALRLDPKSGAALQAEKALAARLLADAHAAIDARDFARASELIQAARGIAAAPDIEAAQGLLAGARRQAEAAAAAKLLNSGRERMQQDRLIEPANDSAKYYLLDLARPWTRATPVSPPRCRIWEPAWSPRRAARWHSSNTMPRAAGWTKRPRSASPRPKRVSRTARPGRRALRRQKFLTNVVAAGNLTLVKSVKPVYPKKADAEQDRRLGRIGFHRRRKRRGEGHCRPCRQRPGSVRGSRDQRSLAMAL